MQFDNLLFKWGNVTIIRRGLKIGMDVEDTNYKWNVKSLH